MNSLCDRLIAEHALIGKVLDAMEAEANRVKAGDPVDRDFVTKAIAFVREFADGTHHHKEEEVLFPKLVEAGMPADGGPVGVMLHEHEVGRGHIRMIADSLEAASGGDAKARRSLLESMSGYIDLLRAHIQKENTILFPMADQILEGKVREQVSADFEASEQSNSVAQSWREWVSRL